MKNTTIAALIFFLLPISFVEAQYNVTNYFEGYEIYDIEQYDGQLYFGMREDEDSPSSIIRFDPVTKTYFTYPDFDFDENSETGKFGRVNISLDQNGAIWCGGYRVGFFDGELWVDKTPEDHTNNHWCSWVEVSGENEIYIHYYGWGLSENSIKYTNYIYIYRNDGWISFFNPSNILDFSQILNSALFTSDGGLWLATNQGSDTFCYKNNEWTTYERSIIQQSLAILEERNGHIWTLGSHSLAEYNGSEWSLYNNQELIPYQYPSDFAIGPDNLVWMACNGCLATFDGSTWTLMTEGYDLPSYVIRSIAISDEGVVYIGTTNGLSVWTPETVSVQSCKPYENSVSVFPNPANPISNITYSIAEPSHVTLDIYSINGQKVDTLVDDYRDAGIHTAAFDGSNLASGLYFYRLQSESFTTTGKLMILK